MDSAYKKFIEEAIDRIMPHLPGRWSRDAWPEGYQWTPKMCLINADGLRIKVESDNWYKRSPKLRLTGVLPKGATKSENERYGSSIGVSAERDPKQAAKDIERRLITTHTYNAQVVARMVKRREDRLVAREEIAAGMAAALGVEIVPNKDVTNGETNPHDTITMRGKVGDDYIEADFDDYGYMHLKLDLHGGAESTTAVLMVIREALEMRSIIKQAA